MEHVSDTVWVLLREPKGPLVPYLDPFARRLDDQGFNRQYIGAQLRVAANFSRWLQAGHVADVEVSDRHAQRFFEEVPRQQSVPRGERAAIRRLLKFLEQLGIIHPRVEQSVETPIQQAVQSFATYLRQDRALSVRTLIQYCPFVEHFLSWRFGREPVILADLRAGEVICFVKQQAAQLSPARAKAATTALRAYFRYLRHRGEIKFDLVAAVPMVPNWSMTGIPRAITPEHLQAVLMHCPRDTPVGRRDYAILLLLARLGLRACEIVVLTLDSINWAAGVITVTGKGNQVASLPLPMDVGEAIAAYIQLGRPTSSSRTLFLRACAPIDGLGAPQSVATIVSAAVKRSGIQIPHRGTHQFRHALATDMLRHGATLTEIGSILRHRHTKTTGIYAKVDFAALRPLSLPWPGGAR